MKLWMVLLVLGVLFGVMLLFFLTSPPQARNMFSLNRKEYSQFVSALLGLSIAFLAGAYQRRKKTQSIKQRSR